MITLQGNSTACYTNTDWPATSNNNSSNRFDTTSSPSTANQIMSLLVNVLSQLLQNTQAQTSTPMASNDAPQPIVTLMNTFRQIEGSLDLSPAQKQQIDSWVAEAKPRREAMEAEYSALRGELREAILTGADQGQIDSLSERLLAKERAIIAIKTECSQMLQDTLDPKQYAQLVNAERGNTAA